MPFKSATLGRAFTLMLLLSGPAIAESRIESVTVASESAAELILDVIYRYEGDRGDRIALSAVMASDGETSAYYAHRPGRVQPGRHRTRVVLGTNRNAPPSFTSNQIEVAMYVGGQRPFLSRRFSFSKTWSRPGARLTPVLELAGIRAELLPAPHVLGPTAPTATDADTGAAVDRRILPDGSIELRYPDGTIRHRFSGGETITRPDGTTSTLLFQNAQPPTPPAAPPDTSHANWLDAENQRLLDILRILVDHDEPSIQNYLEREGTDRTVYQRIEARTRAIAWLVGP